MKVKKLDFAYNSEAVIAVKQLHYVQQWLYFKATTVVAKGLGTKCALSPSSVDV